MPQRNSHGASKMAPNYFRADPNVYKYRMAKVIDWKDSEDEQLTQYIYDDKGCLVREEYGLSKQPGTFVYNYTYNPQLYDKERRSSS